MSSSEEEGEKDELLCKTQERGKKDEIERPSVDSVLKSKGMNEKPTSGLSSVLLSLPPPQAVSTW